jgi:hypothetical protein
MANSICTPAKIRCRLTLRIVAVAFDDVPAVVGQRSDTVEAIGVCELPISRETAGRENGRRRIEQDNGFARAIIADMTYELDR